MKSNLHFTLSENQELSRDGQPVDTRLLERKEVNVEASVIISHYNNVQTIRTAIESALRQSQKEAKIEVVIVDDGTPGNDFEKSTDQFAGLPNFTRAALTENSQATLSRNLAIFLANGDFIIPLDADDEILGEDAIATLIKQFRQNCKASFASTNMVGNIIGELEEEDDIQWVRSLPAINGEQIGERFRGKKLYIREARDYSLWELLEYDYNIGLRLFPKEILEEIGGLDERLGTQCWYSAVLELRTRGEFIPVRENSYLYNIHGGNVSTKQTADRLKRVKEFLLRFFKAHSISYQDLANNCSNIFWQVRGITQEDFTKP